MLGEEPFILLNGDILTDFQFSSLPQHLDTNILAHLLLTPKPPSRESGDFSFEDGRIVSRGGDWVYCGIGLIHPICFWTLRPDRSHFEIYFSQRSNRTNWPGKFTTVVGLTSAASLTTPRFEM